MRFRSRASPRTRDSPGAPRRWRPKRAPRRRRARRFPKGCRLLDQTRSRVYPKPQRRFKGKGRTDLRHPACPKGLNRAAAGHPSPRPPVQNPYHTPAGSFLVALRGPPWAPAFCSILPRGRCLCRTSRAPCSRVEIFTKHSFPNDAFHRNMHIEPGKLDGVAHRRKAHIHDSRFRHSLLDHRLRFEGRRRPCDSEARC